MAINRTYLQALLIVAGLAGAEAAYAQQKIAYVASEAIMDRLPDAKGARTKLVELQTGWLRDITRQEQEITQLRAEIQTNRLLWSTQEKRDAEARLAEMETKLATYRAGKFGPNSEFERRQAELMGPVIEKVGKAIDDEAKAQKYDFVIDKSSRGMPILYSNPQFDITWAVLKRLGVEVSDSLANQPGQRLEGDQPTEDRARRNRGRRDTGTGTEGAPVGLPNQDTPFNPNEDPNKQLPPSGGTQEP